MSSRVLAKIFTISLLMLLAIGSVLGQVAGTKQPEQSALELAYQHPTPWNGNMYNKADSIKFRDRIYFSTGITMESIWGVKDATDNSSRGILSTIVIGYKIAPIHSVELGLMYGVMPYANWELSRFDVRYNTPDFTTTFGVEMRYIFNITSFAMRREKVSKFELYGLTGLSMRNQESSLAVGAIVGLRGQYNLSPNCGIYVEPKFGFHSNNLDGGETYNLYRGHFTTTFTAGLSLSLAADEGYKIGEKGRTSAEDDVDKRIAIKTNCLYLAMATPNIGVEIPLGRRFSVGVDYLFPWYGNRTSGYLYEMQMASAEFRFWFNGSSKLRGVFIGGQAAKGYYDMQYNTVGYQGKSYTSVGGVVGYARQVSRNISVEMSMGFGRMTSSYEKYSVDNDCLVFVHGVDISMLNITKASVGVVWTPNIKKKR